MRLPLMVRYVYDYRPAPSTPETERTDDWLQPQDWATMQARGKSD